MKNCQEKYFGTLGNKEQGTDVTFEVGPGDHEWDFWDTYIKKAIDWLPTEGGELGINSGNIGM